MSARPGSDASPTITAREGASGTSVVDDEAVGRGPTTAPAPLRVPRAMGACGGRPHGRVYGDRVSRVMGGVLRSTREEGARLRVPPRGRGASDDQWCSPPSSCASPLPPLGESARACAAHAASPPSAPAPGGVGRSRRGRPAGRDPALAPVYAARSGCRRRRTVRHPAPPRFAPPGRHGPGAEAGGATPVGACRGPAAAVRAGPAPPPRPRVTAAPAIAVRTPTTPGREPHGNRHHARRRTPAPPNPRDRRVTREHVT